MDIKDSYLHGTVGVVKSISVAADKLSYKLADVAGTTKTVTMPTATQSANGLLSSTDKKKLDSITGPSLSIPYIVGPDTNTTAGTWTGSYSGITSYTEGLTIIYVPKVAGASTTTLNINGLGAKTCYYTGTTKLTTHYAVGTPILLTYVGGYWKRADYDSWTPYVAAYCSTAAATAAKTASCSSYVLTSKTYIHMLITTANTAQSALTMNINSKGAKPIYINGAASSSSNYTLPAGTYIVYYDGTNFYFRTDGILPGTIEKATNATSASKVANNLTIKLKSGSTEGTDLYTYNGSAAKTLDIKQGSNVTLTAAANSLTIAASDTKVTLTNTTTSASYRVLFSGNANDTTETTTARKSANLLFNPSTGNLTTTSLKLNGNIIINDGTNNDRYIQWLYNNTDEYSWRIGYLGSNGANNNFLVFDSYREKQGWATALKFEHTTMIAHFGATVNAPTFQGNLDGTYVNKLTNYAKATAIGSIAAADSLNTALGKLEFKTDFIYNDLFGTDNDDVINKWHEIVDFIDSVKEGTDITDEFVTRKTALTITGLKTFSGGVTLSCGLNINSTHPITWNDGSYHQRIQTADDSTTNTAVFTFQQSSNTGSSWTDLFTIKDNGHVIANKFITSGGTSSQFLKADGSVDSNTYATTSSLSNYMQVGTSGANIAYKKNFNINGTNYDVFRHSNSDLPTVYVHTSKGSNLLSYSNGGNSLQYTTIKYLSFALFDNGGYDSYLLIADLTNWKVDSLCDVALIGTIYGHRGGNQSLTGSYSITAQCTSYTKGSQYVLYTDTYTARTVQPYIVNYNGTPYLALRKRGSGDTIHFIGYATGLLSTYITVNAPTSGGLPSGLTITHKPSYSFSKIATTMLFDGTNEGTILYSGNYTNYINTTNFPGLNKVGTVTSVTVTGANGLSGTGTITTSGTITLSNAGVRSTTINGNYLRVNTNGTNADLTIPYATTSSSAAKWTTARTLTVGNLAKTVDGSANVSWPLHDILLSSTLIGTSTSWDIYTPGVYYVASSSAFTGTGNPESTNGGITPYRYGLLIISKAGNGGVAQFYISHCDSKNTDLCGIKFRTGWNNTYLGTWESILDTSNYTYYTVTKTGTGATGTWGINITGSANKLTNTVTLWGLSFDGTANVSGTLSNVDNIYGSSSKSFYLYLSAAPTNAGNLGTAVGLGCAPNSYGMFMWGTGDGRGHIQSGRKDGTNSSYDLILQEFGSNVGIGITTPTQKLEVNGNVKASKFITTGGTSSQFVKGDGSLDGNTYISTKDLTLELLGVNKILFERFSRVSSVGNNPITEKDLIGRALLDAVLIDDFGKFEVGENYFGRLTTYLYFSANTEWATTGYSDDGSTIYLNDVVIASLTSCKSTSITLNFVKGWNKLVWIFNENAGNDCAYFGSSIKSVSNLVYMNAYPVTVPEKTHQSYISDTAKSLNAITVVSSGAFNLSNASWTDTGYTFASLASGTYAIQVTSGTNLVASGIMSVYKNLSDTAGDEIPLHVYGTAGWRPYLRTYANKLLISSNDASATSRTVTIKIALIL